MVLQLLHDADGQVDIVRQLLIDASQQSTMTADVDHSIAMFEEATDTSYYEDIDSLRELRMAGARGNPSKILAVFRQCNRSIEFTIARLEQQQTQLDERAEVTTAMLILPPSYRFSPSEKDATRANSSRLCDAQQPLGLARSHRARLSRWQSNDRRYRRTPSVVSQSRSR